MWIALILLALLLFGNIDGPTMLCLSFAYLVMVIFEQLFVEPLIRSYYDYRRLKERERAAEESKRQLAERERQKEIELDKYRKRVTAHAEQIYSDIIHGRRPPINFNEITGEKLDQSNPKIREFVRKNNITVEDLIVLNTKLY